MYTLEMKKHEAVRIFGETQTQLGEAVGLTRSRISQWPDVLSPPQVDRVLGAAMRLGLRVPTKFTRRRRVAA